MEENFNYGYIYIAFLVTNTNMGKLIRLFTRNQFSHVTLAFERDLKHMYSFARYHINSPISGGFVIEGPGRYLYDNNDVTVKLCRIPVTKDEYDRILNEVAYFRKNREDMIYNTVNAALSILGKQVSMKNAYTCLEFVTYLLRFTDIFAIRELERRLQKYVIYCGSLRNITKCEQLDKEEHDYFIKRHKVGVFLDTVGHFSKIATRLRVADK